MPFFTNDKYKTSLIYGKQIILVSEEFYEHLKTFIKHVRVRLIDNKVKENKLRLRLQLKRQFHRE